MSVQGRLRVWAVDWREKISAVVELVSLWMHRLYRIPLSDAVPDPFIHVKR